MYKFDMMFTIIITVVQEVLGWCCFNLFVLVGGHDDDLLCISHAFFLCSMGLDKSFVFLDPQWFSIAYWKSNSLLLA